MDDSKCQCPYCGEHFEASVEIPGQTVACPSCQDPFVLPKTSSVMITARSASARTSLSSPQPKGVCPLCGKTKQMRGARTLYGHKVCRNCYYGFIDRRHVAYFLDIIVWSFLIGPIVMVGVSQSEIKNSVNLIFWLTSLIFICKDCFSGYSFGKFICDVRVIDETTGQAISIGASFKRNLPLIIPFMWIIVAFQLYKGHRTGDGWSSSKVIWDKYADNPIFAAANNREGPAKYVANVRPTAITQQYSYPKLGGQVNTSTSPLFRLDKNRTVLITTGMICATILLCGLFIWPTPYRYEKVTKPLSFVKSISKQQVYRINRFTGHSEKIVDP